MANAMYPSAKQSFISGGIDLTSNTIKVYLIDSADYSYSAAHDFADDVATASKVATSGALASKTVTNGTFDAADVTLSTVTGDQSEDIIVWKDTTDQATSPVILFFDTSITGAPVTPNGGDIVIQWNGSGIFAL